MIFIDRKARCDDENVRTGCNTSLPEQHLSIEYDVKDTVYFCLIQGVLSNNIIFIYIESLKNRKSDEMKNVSMSHLCDSLLDGYHVTKLVYIPLFLDEKTAFLLNHRQNVLKEQYVMKLF
jgi:hypothetical protein